MKTFTVTVAYYDACNEQTLVVEADSVEEACTKAIKTADGERVSQYHLHSWDPGVTFVAGIAEGGDLADNDGPYVLDNVIGGPIPFEHSEEAVLGASTLSNVLKTALVALESVLNQGGASGHGDALERLRAITAQIRNTIAGAER
jgi:hypothetical protein